MEATREIYWNVGQAAILPMYFFAFIAIAVLLYGFYRRFGLLFIGTLLVMAQVDFTQPVFDWIFLKGAFYRLFSLTLDVAGLVALVMLGGLLVRRFFIKPDR